MTDEKKVILTSQYKSLRLNCKTYCIVIGVTHDSTNENHKSRAFWLVCFPTLPGTVPHEACIVCVHSVEEVVGVWSVGSALTEVNL